MASSLNSCVTLAELFGYEQEATFLPAQFLRWIHSLRFVHPKSEQSGYGRSCISGRLGHGRDLATAVTYQLGRTKAVIGFPLRPPTFAFEIIISMTLGLHNDFFRRRTVISPGEAPCGSTASGVASKKPRSLQNLIIAAGPEYQRVFFHMCCAFLIVRKRALTPCRRLPIYLH